jgi:hypothetical protein
LGLRWGEEDEKEEEEEAWYFRRFFCRAMWMESDFCFQSRSLSMYGVEGCIGSLPLS